MNKITSLKTQHGFTLIEVLVSLVLFAIGLLGIATQFAGGIQSRINNEIHSSVMQIVAQTIEPLNDALLINDTAFKADLKRLNSGTTDEPLRPFSSTNNSGQENFSITISKAEDFGGRNLLSAEVGTWVPPYNVVLLVSYTGRDNVQLSFPTTHVFIP